MVRMTRAALKAQAQADEYPELPNHTEQEQEVASQTKIRFSHTLVHEDPDPKELEAENKPETDTYAHNNTTDNHPVRKALRDITDENYPKADSDLEVETQAQSPVKSRPREQEQLQEQDKETYLRKSTRKTRGKANGRTKKKTDTPIVIETETEEDVEEQGELQEPSALEAETVAELARPPPAQQPSELTVEPHEEPVQLDDEPGPAIDDELTLDPAEETLDSATPRFDPAVHIPASEARAAEDSFVQSIKSRSPSKIRQSQAGHPQPSDPISTSLKAQTPLRRTSSTNFEESFEAMDSLEDTIEQLTAGLPILPAKEMHSPDSPVKIVRQSLKPGTPAATPNTKSARKPRSIATRTQSVLRAQDKENTPSESKTPLSKHKTPLKTKTPVKKEATPLKPRTTAARQASPNKAVVLSARKTGPTANATTRNDATAPAAIKKPVVPLQNGKSVTVPAVSSKPEAITTTAITKKPAMPISRKPMQRASVAPTFRAPKAEVASKKPTAPVPKSTISTTTTASDKKSLHASSMSLSTSHARQPRPAAHKRRETSTTVLSTSRPPFIPSKSSKPPTTSTFALPGEAVAEKLKAQKEAREQKMQQPVAKSMLLAEQKATKLKAEREAREERVRLNQLKAEEEEKGKKEKAEGKAARPVSMSALTISKARAEAAERGRQASKEWAEKMMKRGVSGTAQGHGQTGVEGQAAAAAVKT